MQASAARVTHTTNPEIWRWGKGARKALGCASPTVGLTGESRALGTSPNPQASQ